MNSLYDFSAKTLSGKSPIGRDGSVAKRYAPQTEPKALEADLEALLAAK